MINKLSDDRRLLHFDCMSGLAGDMILASLIDLGVPVGIIEQAVSKLAIDGYRIRVEKEKRQSIMATRFFVDVDDSKQHKRHYADIKKLIEDADLKPAVKETSIKIFHFIAEAEARVHGSTVDKVHFHEVGAVDSIVDIVGASAAFDHLDAEVSCSPVPLGNGMMKTAHGVIPIPAPATLLILEGVPVTGTEAQAELTTPTGAAVIKTVSGRFGKYPEMVPESTGFGAGARTLETRPGLLRVVLGHAWESRVMGHGPHAVVMEANIDDVTGEVAAHAASLLMKKGALDAWLAPIQMKKGRPAFKLGVICRQEDMDRLAALVFAETPTIGLRYYPVGRYEMERIIKTVDTRLGPVKVKIARGHDGSTNNVSPEYDDCARLAGETGTPLKTIMALATAAGLEQLNSM